MRRVFRRRGGNRGRTDHPAPGLSGSLDRPDGAGPPRGPFFATSFLIAKRLSGTEDTAVIVGLLSLFCTLALAPVAAVQWITPEL